MLGATIKAVSIDRKTLSEPPGCGRVSSLSCPVVAAKTFLKLVSDSSDYQPQVACEKRLFPAPSHSQPHQKALVPSLWMKIVYLNN